MPEFSDGLWMELSCRTGAAIFGKIAATVGLKLRPERVRLVAIDDPIDLRLGMGADGDPISCSEASNPPVWVGGGWAGR